MKITLELKSHKRFFATSKIGRISKKDSNKIRYLAWRDIVPYDYYWTYDEEKAHWFFDLDFLLRAFEEAGGPDYQKGMGIPRHVTIYEVNISKVEFPSKIPKKVA